MTFPKTETLPKTDARRSDVANTAVRYNIYGLVHKGLRAQMAQTLVVAGRTDWSDRDDANSALAEIRALAQSCRSHLQHENHFIHPAMEARQPGSANAAALDHHEHEQAIAGLLADCDRVERSALTERTPVAATLYSRLALFIAENFEHMAMEEVDHNAVLWRHYNDGEIHAIEQALVASIEPEKAMGSLRWMMTAATPTERAEKLRGMQQHAPAPVFMGVLTMLQPALRASDWRKLQIALQLPTVDERDPAELDAVSNQQRSARQQQQSASVAA
ncbi:hypothetical protein HPT27_06680 [Permianibacter sp. IMCC34836]|uniref:hemerythrin domain-containing protein n=1 Tax=Permianibacter fluminis TaxID=2738515 RepID=UPI001557F78F|nr:hemerythrin domain-containing protein [Permianibacter fluminis]NQD36705.1 hypothetical protein [Permianibacter fluminis]